MSTAENWNECQLIAGSALPAALNLSRRQKLRPFRRHEDVKFPSPQILKRLSTTTINEIFVARHINVTTVNWAFTYSQFRRLVQKPARRANAAKLQAAYHLARSCLTPSCPAWSCSTTSCLTAWAWYKTSNEAWSTLLFSKNVADHAEPKKLPAAS